MQFVAAVVQFGVAAFVRGGDVLGPQLHDLLDHRSGHGEHAACGPHQHGLRHRQRQGQIQRKFGTLA